jgi:hypothetical protein
MRVEFSLSLSLSLLSRPRSLALTFITKMAFVLFELLRTLQSISCATLHYQICTSLNGVCGVVDTVITPYLVYCNVPYGCFTVLYEPLHWMKVCGISTNTRLKSKK